MESFGNSLSFKNRAMPPLVTLAIGPVLNCLRGSRHGICLPIITGAMHFPGGQKHPSGGLSVGLWIISIPSRSDRLAVELDRIH